MPVNIIIGLLALVVALVLYTMGALGAFRAKAITKRHVTFLWVGVLFDVLATAMMAIEAGGLDLSPLPDLLHTVVAFVALFGMIAAAYVGMKAVADNLEAARTSVARWVMAPWALWVFVFVCGMLARGSARMGG